MASAQGPRLSTSSGSSWDYLQFPSPRAHPFTLISGALGGGVSSNMSPLHLSWVLSGKGGQSPLWVASGMEGRCW